MDAVSDPSAVGNVVVAVAAGPVAGTRAVGRILAWRKEIRQNSVKHPGRKYWFSLTLRGWVGRHRGGRTGEREGEGSWGRGRRESERQTQTQKRKQVKEQRDRYWW